MPRKKVSGIYEIVHIASGNRYVGSGRSVYDRWSSHKKKLRRNQHHSPHLQRAWNKYGESAFEFRVIEFCLDDRILRYHREQYWIDHHASRLYNASREAVAAREIILTEKDKERLRLARLSLPHRHYTGVLKAEDVFRVFEMYASGIEKHDIAKAMNVEMESIHRILIRKSWWLIEIPEMLIEKCRARMDLEFGRPGIRSKTSKLTAEQAYEIKERLAAGQSPKLIAPLFGVSTATIQAVRNGRTFRWVIYPDVPNTAS